MSDSLSFQQIASVDQRLWNLRNALAKNEYEQDRYGKDLSGQIRRIHDEERRLLGDPALAQAVRACITSDDPESDALERRKAVLLERELRSSSLEQAPEVIGALDDVRKTIREWNLSPAYSALASDPDRTKRQNALAQVAGAGRAIEPAVRRWIRAANTRARELGQENFAEARLAAEGLSIHGLYDLFRIWRREREWAWKETVEAAAPARNGGIRPCDVVFAYTRQGESLEGMRLADGPVRLLANLLTMVGGALEELPIEIEVRDIPFNGACYRISPGTDVRILLRHDLVGISSLSYLLHEFGHAVYYCHCPRDSELLIDPHLAREVLADVWIHFLTFEPFLRRVTSAGARPVRNWLRVRRCQEAAAVVLYIRDSIFTLEILKNPEAPFAETWRDVTNEWLGIDDTSGAFELFDLQHPLDMKSYAFARVLSRNLFDRFVAGPDGAPRADSLRILADTLYRPGNRVDWQQKLDLDGAL